MGVKGTKIIVCLSATLVLVTVVALFLRASEPLSRAVIISSDDAGMCAAVNDGTILALASGVIRSVSIMTCCPAFEDFARFAARHPEYDYGVHLTLTCDLPEQPWGPVLSAVEVPSLVTSDGRFPFLPRDVAASAKIKEVEAELRAQIRKALDAGIRISHLDHHMFVLFARPDLLALYGQLSREFDLPVRFESKPPMPLLEPYGSEVIKAYRRQFQQLNKSKMPILDSIDYDNYVEQAEAKRAYYLSTLRKLRPGTTEIIIHCASKSKSGINPPHVDRRVADRSFFSSKEAMNELIKLQAKVIDWKEFRRMVQSPAR